MFMTLLQQPQVWINPSKSLVDRALDRWSATRLRADNTSVVTLMLDPPGPPRAQVGNSSVRQLNPNVYAVIIYNKPTRCNSGSIVFINNYKYALHVSDALCVRLREHYKL